MKRWLEEERVRYHSATLGKVLAWAVNAADADPLAPHLARVWQTLHDDWRIKTKQMAQLEREIAEILVKTPYILLLSHPGISIITAGELAGEMGPIEHYASAKAITGRAGLFPSRYQSDEVDRGGSLAHMRNARLRAVWVRIGDNLTKCNAHFRGKAALWSERGVDAYDAISAVASRIVPRGQSSRWSVAGACINIPVDWTASTCSTNCLSFIRSTTHRWMPSSATCSMRQSRFRSTSSPRRPPHWRRATKNAGAADGRGRSNSVASC